MTEKMITENKNSDIFSSKEYRRSRKAYVVQCTAEYFVSILVADAFLAKLLSHIGVSDSLTGIISSFISLAFMFQLLSIGLIRRMKNVKRTVIVFDTLSQLFFMSIFLVPFLPCGKTAKTVLVMAGVLLGYFCMYLIYSVYFKWANSFVSANNRGEFSAKKEIISLVSGIVFTLIVGVIIDKTEGVGNITGGFLIVAAIMLLLNAINFWSLMNIKGDDGNNAEDEGASLSKQGIIENIIKNKNFRSVVLMTSLWDIGRYFTIGFMGTYKTKELLLSVGAVQVINMAGNLLRVVVSKPFGRYSDKHSFAKGFSLALVVAAIGFFINIFTTRESIWCVVIFTVLYSAAQAGTNQNSYNIIYSYVDSSYIAQAMAVKNCIGGILGFAASVVGGKILNAVASGGNSIFGMNVYGQQLLSLISFVFIAAAVIYCKTVLEKREVIKQ